MTATTEIPDKNPPVTQANFFQVEIPGLSPPLELGYFLQVSGFSAQLDVLEYLEGGVNDFVHRLPTRIKQGNITLKRGVTKERALFEWFSQTVTNVKPSNLSINVLDSEGNVIKTMSFRNAYPVKWTGSDLNAGGNEFLTQSLEIAHNGMTMEVK
jgi:phage tail-like protein